MLKLYKYEIFNDYFPRYQIDFNNNFLENKLHKRKLLLYRITHQLAKAQCENDEYTISQPQIKHAL